MESEYYRAKPFTEPLEKKIEELQKAHALEKAILENKILTYERGKQKIGCDQ